MQVGDRVWLTQGHVFIHWGRIDKFAAGQTGRLDHVDSVDGVTKGCWVLFDGQKDPTLVAEEFISDIPWPRTSRFEHIEAWGIP